MQKLRPYCWVICFIGVVQFFGWTGYTFEASSADKPAVSMHTYGAAWSPWLTRTCQTPVDRPLGRCDLWDDEVDPLSMSVLLLLVGIAGGAVAYRLRPPRTQA
jgi:hypothetical protein